jgi:hypothetical protein
VRQYKGQTQFEMKRRSMNASLQNKVAVVTSGTLEIGRAADLAHPKTGAKVVVAGHRESEEQAVVHGIENSGGRGLFVKPNVALEADWASRQQNARNWMVNFAKGEAARKPNESPYAHEVRTYAQLQRHIHHSLRAQHPEWIQPDGDCPMCDAYESRLAILLGLSPGVSDGSVTTETEA